MPGKVPGTLLHPIFITHSSSVCYLSSIQVSISSRRLGFSIAAATLSLSLICLFTVKKTETDGQVIAIGLTFPILANIINYYTYSLFYLPMSQYIGYKRYGHGFSGMKFSSPCMSLPSSSEAWEPFFTKIFILVRYGKVRFNFSLMHNPMSDARLQCGTVGVNVTAKHISIASMEETRFHKHNVDSIPRHKFSWYLRFGVALTLGRWQKNQRLAELKVSM